MGKIVVFNMMSVDGYYAGSDGNIDWHTVDDEFNEFAIEHTAEFGTLIFGETTYKLFEGFWPQALKDPATSDDDRKIAQVIEDARKIVYSKSRTSVLWNNSQLEKEIDPEKVKQWKEESEKDLAIFGSGKIVQQFANLDLIDEYHLMVNPIVLGVGKNLFEGVKQRKLKLIKTREFKNGNILLYYQPQTR